MNFGKYKVTQTMVACEFTGAEVQLC